MTSADPKSNPYAGYVIEGPIASHDADLFGFKSAIETTTRFFSECPTPILFAVYGRSGSGRTSFLSLLTKNLSDNDSILRMEFSARPFRNSNNLVRTLLRKMEQCLQVQDKERFQSLKRVAAAAPDPLDDRFDEWVDKTDSLRQDLADITKDSLDALGKKTLFLTIDDLDLCTAHLKIQLIEFVAEFLSAGPIVLVITVDRKQLISDYLASHVFVAERQASLYLERIFPHSYTIPWIGEDQLIDYVIDALEQVNLVDYDRSKKNRDYNRFRRMVEVYLRRAAVTPIKIVHELIKFSRMHSLSNTHGVEAKHALFAIAIKSQFPEVYRFLLDKGERGHKDLRKVFNPDQDFSAAGFTVRYGRRLDRMLADTALRDLFVAYDHDHVDWPTFLAYLSTAAFVPSPY